MDEDDSNGYVNTSNDNSDVMWMKMALQLMAARRAAVPKYAEGKPIVAFGYGLFSITSGDCNQ